MTILFLHGWHSVPGGVKPTYLKEHGHAVINPALDDDDFAAALATAAHRSLFLVVASPWEDAESYFRGGESRVRRSCSEGPRYKNSKI